MRGRRLRLRLLALLALFGLFAAACGDDDSGGDTGGAEDTTTTAAAEDDGGAETTTTAAEDGGDGGEEAASCDATIPGSVLNFGVYVPTASLDPLQSSAAQIGGVDLSAIYDVLTRWNPETGDWEMQLAESLEPNEDYTEWTLTLREGVTYSDGSPMLAQHVLDHFVRMTGEGRNATRGLLERVDLDNSEAIDDRTVVFRLPKPWVKFAYLLGDATGMVVNPAVTSDDPAGIDAISAEGAGAGPYVVDRWAPGESPYLVLKARDDYWGGPVCTETINLIHIPTDQPKWDALELGEIDVAFFRTQDVIEEARASGKYQELGEVQSAGAIVLINHGRGTADPITTDLRFRQAVSLALDPSRLNQAAYGGTLIESKGFVHEASRFWTDAVEEAPTDPDRARELVEELKAEGWDGTVRMSCSNTSPDVAVAIEAALEAVGMDVEPDLTDVNTSVVRVVTGDLDIGCGWSWAISDSTILRSIDFNFRSDSAANRMGWANPEMDAAIDDLFAAETLEEQQAAVAEMARIYNEDMPSANYGVVEETIFIREGVKGIKQTQQSVFLLDDVVVED